MLFDIEICLLIYGILLNLFSAKTREKHKRKQKEVHARRKKEILMVLQTFFKRERNKRITRGGDTDSGQTFNYIQVETT